MFCFVFQFTRKLDDLLGFLYDDKEADTVELAQEALKLLQEKVDAIGTYHKSRVERKTMVTQTYF